MGNPHCAIKGKQIPMSFYRQVLALCELPRDIGVDHPLVEEIFPNDAISRAKEILQGLEEYGGIGSYVEPKGVRMFREHVASFIEARDGYPSNANNIFLTNGASSAIQLCLDCILENEDDAIMLPSFHYQIYSDKAKSMGRGVIEYALEKDDGWTITYEALEEAYRIALETGKNVKCLCIINPGNPTGSVLSEDAIVSALQFCASRKIILLADEVYQDNVYSGNEFISAKKVASKCDEKVQLVSFHSTSKGFLGECGRRGGYMETFNMPNVFHDEVLRLIGETLPCANTIGQVMTSLMAKPPRVEEASFATFTREKRIVSSAYEKRAELIVDGLNNINGIKCPPIQGAIYVFPSIEMFPLAAIHAAEKQGIAPDQLYCLELLESTGLYVTPASTFSTSKCKDIHGFRMSLLFHEDDVPSIVEKISKHHHTFLCKYSISSIPPSLQVEMSMNQIELKRLDHYTMICDDAKAVSDYHVEQLGFKLLRTIHLNTGTVADDEIDMLNYVLQPPEDTDKTLVVTEGKNDETIFRKYSNIWGAGIHHVAFEVEDIEASFSYLKMHQIKTTSDRITKDMLTGLKQLFIDPCHAGFFIELIERPKSKSDKEEDTMDKENRSYFAKKNMVDLANSMHSVLTADLLSDEEGTLLDDDPTPLQTSPASDGSNDNVLVDNPKIGLSCTEKNSIKDTQNIGYVPNENGPTLGPLRMIGFKVESWNESMKFLLDTFNFRFVKFDQARDRIFLGLDSKDTENSFGLSLQKVSEASEFRQAFVSFASTDISLDQDGDCDELALPKQNTIYQINLVADSLVNLDLQPVKVSRSDLCVHINRSEIDVVNFLLDPRNLSQWTGHKSIHYSRSEESWVEVRMNQTNQLIKSPLQVNRRGNTVEITWTHRNLTIEILTKRLSSDITEICLGLPTTLPTKLVCKLRRMIMIELNILKAILEDNTHFIPDSHFQQVESFHLEIFNIQNMHSELEVPSCFQGEMITLNSDERLFRKMSTDFALTIHSDPYIILKPKSNGDIKTAIQMATDLGLQLVVRGSEISHSAGGQAQTDGGILLDISDFKELTLNDADNTLRIGSGCYWNDVVQFTLDHGYMPPVVNDYQYLSVGGTISMGGVGFMSHKYGIQAGHVKELQVVSGQGNVVRASKDHNQDLFDVARSGLGQFGVVTSVSIPLVPAPKNIVTLKFFYTQTEGHDCFVNDMKTFVDLNIDMIHAFLKPCKVATISKLVDKELNGEFKETIIDGESKGEVVYFVELGIYETPEASNISADDVKKLIQRMNIIGKTDGIFESSHDFMTYLRRDPPVISTNKSQGKSVPHPSFATTLAEDTTNSLLAKHINSPFRGDDSTNEILIMPIKSNKYLGSGSPTPMFPLPKSKDGNESDLSFFILFLGSAISKPDGDESSLLDEINCIRNHHRELYKESKKLAAKHYCYDTITCELKEEDWKEHYGVEVWSKIVEAKHKYDPFYLFRSKGVKFFD